MNENEYNVVEATDRLKTETSKRLEGIKRQLEYTTEVSTAAKAKLSKNSSRLEKVKQDADGLLISTKTAHILLNRLRRWGASSHVGRHRDLARILVSQKKKIHKKNGSERTASSTTYNSRIEELFNQLNVDGDKFRDEEQEQRARTHQMERLIPSEGNTATAAKKNAHTAPVSNEQDETLNRIGSLLDGLHDEAKEYKSILDSQKTGLDHIDNTLGSVSASMQKVNRLLRT